MKVEWKCVLTTSGVQCVMIFGVMKNPKLCADNWVSVQMVK